MSVCLHVIKITFPGSGKVLKSEKLVLFLGNVLFFLCLVFIIGVHAAKYYKLWEEEKKVGLARNIILKSFSVKFEGCIT